MPIPKHDDIRIPALELLKTREELKLKEFEAPLAEQFSLTSEEVAEQYESGNGHIFYDRISWALSYLNMAGLVEKPRRGIYRLSETGKKLIETPQKVNPYIDKQVNKRKSKSSKSDKTTTQKIAFTEPSSELTPQEKLYRSFTEIRKSIYQDILSTILSKSPIEFEKLVVMLLQAMGYGGEIKNSGLVTKYSNDGGIDGIIKEDILGLGRIHIQAKRYKLDSGVGREAIQSFVGALAVAQSNKGVFITTSYFTKAALDYAESLNGSTTVVLIDGEKLSQYIYDFDLGMQIDQVIKIKKLDTDFWDSMQDRTDK
ncbi:restriction endonuclease [Neolewinella aurantiaca]|uniref:Restriction endonuclease n=1 Tax=Neolewinella aurantiaca TaxID=2602767 RepID=A0A5C7FHR3_9BACT|nr:restriction endonuclease [Neolewinella aurantiaca]TXF90657.1 restriction endonuclease [Neolewinella aurantiaca]